ncbi:MAG: glycosyltransferase family 4 protein [Acidobacteriota bacterium]
MSNQGKRILLCDIQVPFTKGGAEALWDGLEAALVSAGFRVERVEVPFSWSSKTGLLESALTWRSLPLAGYADLAITTRFPTYCISFNNKVVWLQHQHRAVYELFGDPAYSDFAPGLPLDEDIRASIHRIDNRCLAECKAIFATSRNVAERLLRNNGLKAEVLRPPAPMQGLRFREQEDFVFLPSRLEANKRPDVLIDAMSLVQSPLRCVLTGTGGMEPLLRERIKRLGVDGRVELRGYVREEEVRDLYERCLAVVYPPKDEDLGFVTMEAFQAEKPVITLQDSGGPLEFVEDGRTGFVVRDASQVASALDRLYNRRQEAREMGRAARSKVEQLALPWETIVERLTRYV